MEPTTMKKTQLLQKKENSLNLYHDLKQQLLIFAKSKRIVGISLQ